MYYLYEMSAKIRRASSLKVKRYETDSKGSYPYCWLWYTPLSRNESGAESTFSELTKIYVLVMMLSSKHYKLATGDDYAEWRAQYYSTARVGEPNPYALQR